MKFNDFLGEPQQFNDGTWVVSAEYSKEEFYEYLLENESDFEDTIKEEFIESVEEDWVHFHIDGGAEVYDRPMWWLGCKGMKGAKKVLTY